MTLHAGWFRCRIRGQVKTNYPWIYYHLTLQGSKIALRREARYKAGLFLHRQIFDFEAIYPPDKLTPIKTVDGTEFYYRDALQAPPVPPLFINGGSDAQ